MKLFLLFFLINSAIVEKPEMFLEKGPDYQKRFEKILLNKSQKNLLNKQQGFILDTTKYLTPLPEDQTHPDVTFDGENYFVVWQDWDGYNEIRATRVDTQGNVIDYRGMWLSDLFCIPYQQYVSTVPGVAFGDSVYLVAFGDIRYADFDLFGVRVRQDGTVLDPGGFDIVSNLYNQGSSRVSFDGTNFLIVFADFDYDNNHSEVWSVRVSPDGTVLDPGGFPVRAPQIGTNAKQPDVSFDGTNYLVVYKLGTDVTLPYVVGSRVRPDGTVIDSAGFIISPWETSWGWPSVTFGGNNYFVVWRDTTFDIVGTRVTPDGIVLDVPPISISPVSLRYTEEPKVTFDGQNYLVFWNDGDTEILYLTRVDLQGNVLDPSPIQIAITGDPGLYRNAGSSLTNSIIVWAHQTGDIYASRVDTSGNVLDPDGFPVSVSFNFQEFPALSFDNQNYFSVWSEYRDNYWNIYGIRTDPAGNRMDNNAFVISPRNWTQYWNRTAFLDSIYLVVWHALPNTWDVHGARVTSSGNVLDPLGIAIGAWQGNQGYPSVSAGDSNFFAVWDDDRNGAEDIYGAIITLEGQNLNPTGIPIFTTGTTWFPHISFGGTNYFVVWENVTGNWGEIYGSRVSQDGTVLDPSGILINSNYSTLPRITFSNNQYLVVWMDIRTLNNYDIYASRIRQDGTVLDPGGFPVCTNSSDQAFPDVTFDGENYIVLWEDYRNGNPDVYGAVIDTSGSIIDTLIVSNNAVPEFYPALTRGPGNQVFFNYTVYEDREFYANRIYGYLYPTPEVEEDIGYKTKKFQVKIFPNPFFSSFNLSYFLLQKSAISLKLYSSSGRLIKTMFDGLQPAGNYSISQNLKNLPSGVYFIRIKTSDFENYYKLLKN